MSGTATQEGDFSLADELTGKQRRESLQTNGKEKQEVKEISSGKMDLFYALKYEVESGTSSIPRGLP